MTVTLKRFRCGRTFGDVMFSRFRKKDEPEKRVCPFCEIENPLDAKSCTQCFFQFERASREQDEALSEHEEGTLLDELLNSQVEIEADETVPVDVITMDDMTVEPHSFMCDCLECYHEDLRNHAEWEIFERAEYWADY